MVARQVELVGHPAVEEPTYQWPKKLLLRKKASDQNNAYAARSELDAGVFTVNINPPVQPGQGRMLPTPPRLPLSDPSTVSPSLPVIAEESDDSRAHVGRAEGVSDQPVHFIADPTLRLHGALAQCMRLEIDFLDEDEATVYFHEGTELLSGLRNQLAAFPELRDPSPKADLSTAYIGDPGITTAEIESQAEVHTLTVSLMEPRPGNRLSLPKSEFGKRTISYLFHEIGAEGIRAKPKIAKGVMDLPFPSTLKGVQSFLGSLNYYNKFIEDLSVIASVLYELTDEQIQAGRDLSRAKEAFEVLKPCAVLDQEHDGVILPVRFTGRVLNDQELRYHPAEKEVVALIRVLSVFYTMLAGTKLIKVYTRHSVLKWIFTSRSLKGRCEQWETRLEPCPVEIHRIQQDEDGLAAIMGAGITPPPPP
ncbi:hypothetical protein ON010_g5229 [Phytophthora cinnamomi]|nr:hypothetical protein ON010_g5229 [Phytophthora cinnamomi]